MCLSDGRQLLSRLTSSMISKIPTILMFKDIWLKPSRYKHLKSKNVQTYRMISYLTSITYLKSFSGRKDKVIN